MDHGVLNSLDDERATTLARLASLEHELNEIMSAGQQNGDDEHDPEGATIAFERARTISLLQEARLHLDHIEDALARVVNGTYGTCTTCQGEIDPLRLIARPETRSCILCASRTAP
jgi:RNA polymerase-binding transcription factor DksA